MLREKNLYALAKQLFFSLALFCFALFLSLGNLPRIIENSLFTDHLLLSELALYFFSLASLLFIKAPLRSFLYLIVISLLVVSSFCYGLFLQGMDLQSALYALRLIALLGTVFSLTHICLEKFQSDLTLFFSFVTKIYVFALILSFLLFLFFFSSEDLWEKLRLYNILFHGDPHRGRFVSVYFDPNYYAAIVGIPMLATYYLYQKTRKKRFIFILSLFGVSALLTWSRSGLFVLGILLIWLAFFPPDRRGLSQKKLKGCILFIVLMSSTSLLFWEDLGLFVKRLLFTGSDPSALSRLYTFKWGLDFWKEHPLFGVGYNFLHTHVKQEIGLNSLDSSLLSLLIQIGGIPFLALLGIGAYKMQHLRKTLSLCKPEEKKLLKGLILYGLLILFFASHFNQLLFYPFWFLPFMLIAFFSITAMKKESEKVSLSDSF